MWSHDLYEKSSDFRHVLTTRLIPRDSVLCFYNEFKPFWFKNQAQLRIYGELVCKEFARSFLQVNGNYVLTV